MSKTLGNFIMCMTLAYLVVFSLKGLADTDSSDYGPWERSNVVISIDALTGCHYLQTWSGSITPRMYSDGVQVCIGREE